MTVESMCRKNKVVFRMKNEGNAWPGAAKLKIVDAGDGHVISSRTMKLKSNQSAGFSIRPDGDVDEMDLQLEATWLSEPFELGLGQSCS